MEGGGVDAGLFVGAADAFECGGGHAPVRDFCDFAGEFFGLVEAALQAAGPVEGNGDHDIDGDRGGFGDAEHGLVEEGGEDFGDFPGAGEFEAVDEGDEGFLEGADAGDADDAHFAFATAATGVAGVVGFVRADGQAAVETVGMGGELGDFLAGGLGEAGGDVVGRVVGPAGWGEEEVDHGSGGAGDGAEGVHGGILEWGGGVGNGRLAALLIRIN